MNRVVQAMAGLLMTVVVAAGCSSEDEPQVPPPPRDGEIVHPLHPTDVPPTGPGGTDTGVMPGPGSRPNLPYPAERGTQPPTVPPGPSTSTQVPPVLGDARDALQTLPVRAESTMTYRPGVFPVWAQVDGGPCDTRQFLMRATSEQAPEMVLGTCEVTSGLWTSPYDERKWSDPDDVAVDHVVPLPEAWESGADRWDVMARAAFANDLNRDVPQLLVVTDEVHQAKAGKDPAEWMPSSNACGYAAVWVLIKERWGLTVDPNEKAALGRALDRCTQ